MKEQYSPLRTFYIGMGQLKKTYLEKEVAFIDYARIGVDLSMAGRVELADMMYEKVMWGRGKSETQVVFDSYTESRKVIVDAMIELLIEEEQKGNSVITIIGNLRAMKLFVRWTLEHNEVIPESIDSAHRLYERYSLVLRGQVRQGRDGGISSATGHIQQVAAKRLLQEMLGDEENVIGMMVPMLGKKSALARPTVFDGDEVEYAFNYYYDFFNQATDFLLNEELYPFCLDFADHEAWIVPHRSHWIRPQGDKNFKGLVTFDYDNGVVLSEEEALKRSKNPKRDKWNTQKRRKNFLRGLEEANKDFSHSDRLALGRRAMDAYFMVMLALTGVNDRVLANTNWDNSYDKSSGKQGFKVIKPRAKYKTISFEIQNEFIGGFEKFLRLRDYLLLGEEFPFLFFSGFGKDAFLAQNSAKGNTSSRIFRQVFQRLNSELPAVVSRQFRLYRSKWVKDEMGIWHASISNQSLKSTMDNHYHGEAIEEQEAQMSNFLNSVHQKILSDESMESYRETSVGKCAELDNPQEEIEGSPVKPDCIKPEGCLFCVHYRCHPDEQDIRKLLSVEFIVNEVLVVNAESKEHFDRVLGPVVKRIEAFTDMFKEESTEIKNLVKWVREDVYEEENLHPYWEMKMKTLYDMGAAR